MLFVVTTTSFGSCSKLLVLRMFLQLHCVYQCCVALLRVTRVACTREHMLLCFQACLAAVEALVCEPCPSMYA
jgi:hypothetical protein